MWYLILVLLVGENEKVFLCDFFEHPKEILRQADLNSFLSDQAFAILVSGKFHVYIGALFC